MNFWMVVKITPPLAARGHMTRADVARLEPPTSAAAGGAGSVLATQIRAATEAPKSAVPMPNASLNLSHARMLLGDNPLGHDPYAVAPYDNILRALHGHIAAGGDPKGELGGACEHIQLARDIAVSRKSALRFVPGAGQHNQGKQVIEHAKTHARTLFPMGSRNRAMLMELEKDGTPPAGQPQQYIVRIYSSGNDIPRHNPRDPPRGPFLERRGAVLGEGPRQISAARIQSFMGQQGRASTTFEGDNKQLRELFMWVEAVAERGERTDDRFGESARTAVNSSAASMMSFLRNSVEPATYKQAEASVLQQALDSTLWHPESQAHIDLQSQLRAAVDAARGSAQQIDEARGSAQQIDEARAKHAYGARRGVALTVRVHGNAPFFDRATDPREIQSKLAAVSAENGGKRAFLVSPNPADDGSLLVSWARPGGASGTLPATYDPAAAQWQLSGRSFDSLMDVVAFVSSSAVTRTAQPRAAPPPLRPSVREQMLTSSNGPLGAPPKRERVRRFGDALARVGTPPPDGRDAASLRAPPPTENPSAVDAVSQRETAQEVAPPSPARAALPPARPQLERGPAGAAARRPTHESTTTRAVSQLETGREIAPENALARAPRPAVRTASASSETSLPADLMKRAKRTALLLLGRQDTSVAAKHRAEPREVMMDQLTSLMANAPDDARARMKSSRDALAFAQSFAPAEQQLSKSRWFGGGRAVDRTLPLQMADQVLDRAQSHGTALITLGSPRQPILVELRREPSAGQRATPTYSLRLFNTGEGAQSHAHRGHNRAGHVQVSSLFEVRGVALGEGSGALSRATMSRLIENANTDTPDSDSSRIRALYATAQALGRMAPPDVGASQTWQSTPYSGAQDTVMAFLKNAHPPVEYASIKAAQLQATAQALGGATGAKHRRLRDALGKQATKTTLSAGAKQDAAQAAADAAAAARRDASQRFRAAAFAHQHFPRTGGYCGVAPPDEAAARCFHAAREGGPPRFGIFGDTQAPGDFVLAWADQNRSGSQPITFNPAFGVWTTPAFPDRGFDSMEELIRAMQRKQFKGLLEQ